MSNRIDFSGRCVWRLVSGVAGLYAERGLSCIREAVHVMRDIISGALPLWELPRFLLWLWRQR